MLKKIWQNLTPLHVKSRRKIRNSRPISKHSKSNIHQTSIKHQMKWRETWNNPTKTRNTTRLPTLSLRIKYSTWFPSQSNQTIKGDQSDTNWKWRNQNITVCWWYDSTTKWPQKFHQWTTKPNKQLQQSDWI